MALNLTRSEAWDYEDPVEIPGLGQIPGNIIDDAVTRGRWMWQQEGAARALSAWGTELQNMIELKTWRSQDAYDMLAFLQRQALVSCGTLTHQSNITHSIVEAVPQC